MVFVVNMGEDKIVKEMYEKAMQELDDFFELGWKINRPKVFLVPDRKTIDELKGNKTEGWVTGLTVGTNVYILNKENYEKESLHTYSDEKYYSLLKHELAHTFTLVISGFNQKPRWLWEGIAICLSGQNNFMKKPEKLENFLKFGEQDGEVVDVESGFAVKFLIEKYGKGKVIELIKSLKETHSSQDFMRKFEEIYGFELDYKNFS